MWSLTAGLYDLAKLFLFCPTIVFDVTAGLSIGWLTVHPTRVLAVFKSVQMPGPARDPRTFEICDYKLFYLPSEVVLVKATLLIQIQVGKHGSESHNMVGFRQVNGASILFRKHPSVIPFFFWPE